MNQPHHDQKHIKEKVYDLGDDYYRDLLKDIEQAKKNIALEMYIFTKDALGIDVQKALIAAANRGVSVRILVDGVGSPYWGGAFTRQLEDAGVETRVFHPMPWVLWQWSRSVVRLPVFIKWAYLLYKMNRRNHRKMFILDEHIVYISSMNIDQNHLSVASKGGGWRDVGIRLQGRGLDEALHAFEGAWDHHFLKKRLDDILSPEQQGSSMRFNNSRHRRRAQYKKLLRSIARAKKRIWITNAYFVPDIFLLKKLKDAAGKGVDVQIVLPRHADVSFVPWLSHAYYENLLLNGVKIFEYLPGMLHAKTIMIDDQMIIGTSNLNHRSLLHDLEVDVFVHQAHSKKTLIAQFEATKQSSQEVHVQDHHRIRPWYQRWLGHVIFYVRYWM
jgi:cardiolipin synthase A/B